MSGRKVIFNIVGAAMAFGVLMFLFRTGTLHRWMSHLVGPTHQKHGVAQLQLLLMARAPNPSLQPTVSPSAALPPTVPLPSQRFAQLGAAELQR